MKHNNLKMRKIKKLAIYVSMTLCLSVSQSSFAASKYSTGGVSDKLFYKVGGGSVIASNFMFDRANSFGAGIKWNSNLMCGNFDMKSTVANQLNGVTEGFNNMMGNVISEAKGAVASLPALVIQRANPQLYDLLTNGVLQGKLDFAGIKADCKQMANKMTDFADTSGLVQAAKAENFSNMLNSKVDAIRSEKQLEEVGGALGLSWIGGKNKGGTNQQPINIVKDVALAGYNSLLGRSAEDTSAVSGASERGSIFSTWDSPTRATNWLNDVLGERTLITADSNSGQKSRSADTSGESAQSGRGLNPKTQEYYEEYYQLLVSLVNGASIDEQSLEKLNKGSLSVTRNTIEALREDSERGVLVNRLASEMALSRAIEEALMARRLLLAGRKEPNVAKNEKAQKQIMDQINELDMELNQVKLEYDMRKSIAGNTLETISDRKLQRQRGLIISNGVNESQKLNENN